MWLTCAGRAVYPEAGLLHVVTGKTGAVVVLPDFTPTSQIHMYPAARIRKSECFSSVVGQAHGGDNGL